MSQSDQFVLDSLIQNSLSLKAFKEAVEMSPK